MKKKWVITTYILICLLAACTPALAPSVPGVDADGVIQTWIDAPIDGDHLPLSPCEIVIHANAPAGVQNVVLLINEQPVPIDGVPTGKAMSEVHYSWRPPAPGVYDILAYTIDQNNQQDEGSRVEVMVVGAATATATQTPTTTPSPTPTHTPAPSGLLAGLTVDPQELVYGSCGENRVSFSAQVQDTENTLSLLLFVRLIDVSSGERTTWNTGFAMNPTSQEGGYYYQLSTTAIPGMDEFNTAYLEYQFVGIGQGGAILGHSPNFSDVGIAKCGFSLPPMSITRPGFSLNPTATNTPVVVK